LYFDVDERQSPSRSLSVSSQSLVHRYLPQQTTASKKKKGLHNSQSPKRLLFSV
jgi:hypothetical protein